MNNAPSALSTSRLFHRKLNKLKTVNALLVYSLNPPASTSKWWMLCCVGLPNIRYYWFSVGFLHLNLIDVKHGHKSLSFFIIRLSQTVDNVSRFCDPISFSKFLFVFDSICARCVGLRLYFYRCSPSSCFFSLNFVRFSVVCVVDVLYFRIFASLFFYIVSMGCRLFRLFLFFLCLSFALFASSIKYCIWCVVRGLCFLSAPRSARSALVIGLRYMGMTSDWWFL